VSAGAAGAFHRHAEQQRAAHPNHSVWVSANAGAGKTLVLVDRVCRLLLQAVHPGRILCLTFTKAAAAEMAERLYRRLGEWAVLDDAHLKHELRDLTQSAEQSDLDSARRLFAATLDAAGGLRIQTIHAFCESVLKRFPLEAGLPPHFAVADETVANALVHEARARLLEEAAIDGELDGAMRFVGEAVAEGGFKDLVGEILRERGRFEAALAGGVAAARLVLRESLAVTDDDETALIERFCAAIDSARMSQAARALAKGAKTDRGRSIAILAFLARADRALGFDEAWRPLFLTEKGGAREKTTLASIGALNADAGVLAIMLDEQQRVLDLAARRKAMGVARASGALLVLADRVLRLYREAKRARALVDYHDLILATARLLREESSWVLYKLDGGIDHVLVDEAQDTAREQWDIIKSLTAEFFAGEGAGRAHRTVFAVGDEKQSIFSFQGADPVVFQDMRAWFEARAAGAGQRVDNVPILRSFRSTKIVLDAVDKVFDGPQARDGVVTGEHAIKHLVTRQGAGGLVELWPPVVRSETAEPDPWTAPLDYQGPGSPPVILADRVALTIGDLIGRRETLVSRGRPIRPGDIAILVRKRDALFEALVRALKRRGVPVAGADRLRLVAHIAVMDLIALGRFCLLPDDDLNLATLLKSPLCGFTDDDLLALCWKRDRRLWPSLRARAGDRPRWQAAVEELGAILAMADLLPPASLYGMVLGSRGGRRRMLARLGHEVLDPIEEFLRAAADFQSMHPPSLTGFLAWLESGGAEVKREQDQGRDQVRIMTVHSAKGLEADIVFLPDTCTRPDGRHDPSVLWTDRGTPLWPIKRERDDPVADAAREAARRRRDREYRRLLYVAMTRARDRLYVCGHHGGKLAGESWYRLVEPAIRAMAGAAIDLPWGEQGWRVVGEQAADSRPLHADAPAKAPIPALPDWAQRPAPAEPLPPRPLTPSRIDGEPAVASPARADREAALRRGRMIHRLLELLPDLPPARRHQAALRWLGRPSLGLDPSTIDAMAAEIGSVLDHPALAQAFAEGSIAEAPIVGRLGNRLVAGQIDRLWVGVDRVLLVDYKTNRPPPGRVEDVASAYVAQMAAYRAVLRRIYPGRVVDAALVWTYGATVMPLPHGLLDAVAESTLSNE
jgi:ATP-dependent helicase/nuclease subunit A